MYTKNSASLFFNAFDKIMVWYQEEKRTEIVFLH